LRRPPDKWLALSLGLASALALFVSDAGAASARRFSDARLEGTFTMRGTITFVDNVYGEHRGQHVVHTWKFFPRCRTSPCRRVWLVRRRGSRSKLDVMMLHRRAPGVYVGNGRFWIPLLCAGRIVTYGGVAPETITVRITRTQKVGTTRFATAVSATYNNPTRINQTRCPGGIGHDAARYSGRLTSPLPGPPTAGFTVRPNSSTASATFTDESHPGRGGAPIVRWSWNFGEPASPSDTSTQRNPTHQYAAHGTYTVTLTVRDRYGQTAIATAQVTV
jgi:hypothetical protein